MAQAEDKRVELKMALEGERFGMLKLETSQP